MTKTHYESKVQELRIGALRSHGDAPTALREQVEEFAAEHSGRPATSPSASVAASLAASSAAGIPPGVRDLIEKITLNAYKVTDEDIEHLLHEGYSQDAAFELIVSTAVGAGAGRFERAMHALRDLQDGDVQNGETNATFQG